MTSPVTTFAHQQNNAASKKIIMLPASRYEKRKIAGKNIKQKLPSKKPLKGKLYKETDNIVKPAFTQFKNPGYKLSDYNKEFKKKGKAVHEMLPTRRTKKLTAAMMAQEIGGIDPTADSIEIPTPLLNTLWGFVTSKGFNTDFISDFKSRLQTRRWSALTKPQADILRQVMAAYMKIETSPFEQVGNVLKETSPFEQVGKVLKETTPVTEAEWKVKMENFAEKGKGFYTEHKLKELIYNSIENNFRGNDELINKLKREADTYLMGLYSKEIPTAKTEVSAKIDDEGDFEDKSDFEDESDFEYEGDVEGELDLDLPVDVYKSWIADVKTTIKTDFRYLPKKELKESLYQDVDINYKQYNRNVKNFMKDEIDKNLNIYYDKPESMKEHVETKEEKTERFYKLNDGKIVSEDDLLNYTNDIAGKSPDMVNAKFTEIYNAYISANPHLAGNIHPTRGLDELKFIRGTNKKNKPIKTKSVKTFLEKTENSVIDLSDPAKPRVAIVVEEFIPAK